MTGFWAGAAAAAVAAGAGTLSVMAITGTGPFDNGEEEPKNIDCEGVWSHCTERCEQGEDRTWITLVYPSGTGSPCPNPSSAPNCLYGVDDCNITDELSIAFTFPDPWWRARESKSQQKRTRAQRAARILEENNYFKVYISSILGVNEERIRNININSEIGSDDSLLNWYPGIPVEFHSVGPQELVGYETDRVTITFRVLDLETDRVQEILEALPPFVFPSDHALTEQTGTRDPNILLLSGYLSEYIALQNILELLQKDWLPLNSLTARLVLDTDLSSIPEGTQERAAFESNFKTDVALLNGVTPERIVILRIQDGSAIVDFVVLPEADSTAMDKVIIDSSFTGSGVSIAGSMTKAPISNIRVKGPVAAAAAEEKAEDVKVWQNIMSEALQSTGHASQWKQLQNTIKAGQKRDNFKRDWEALPDSELQYYKEINSVVGGVSKKVIGKKVGLHELEEWDFDWEGSDLIVQKLREGQMKASLIHDGLSESTLDLALQSGIVGIEEVFESHKINGNDLSIIDDVNQLTILGMQNGSPCMGSWSDCTSLCETANQRVWTQIQAQTGAGKPCPSPSPCSPGEGKCPHDIDCVGNWSKCSTTCTQVYDITIPVSGSGKACEALMGDIQTCSPGTDYCPFNCNVVSPVNGSLSECGSELQHGLSCNLACNEGYTLQGEQQPLCNNGVLSNSMHCIKDIDCVGTWSPCLLDCSDSEYIISVNQSGSGSACEAQAGDIQTCSPGEGACPLNTDCKGEWGDCTIDCERIWSETTPQSGTGTGCPTTYSPCQPGEDACPSNCEGAWSKCSTTCTSVWIQTQAHHGTGTPCPNNIIECEPGIGHCPFNCRGISAPLNGSLSGCTSEILHGSTCELACNDGYTLKGTQPSCNNGVLTNSVECIKDIDCVGDWSECSTTCTEVYNVTSPLSGSGEACNAVSGDIRDCSPGTDNCPIICNSGEKPDPSECTADCEVLITIPTSIPLNRVDECTTLTHICMPGNGQCCIPSWSYDNKTEQCVPDIDCEGTWSECTSNCETSEKRTWTTIVSPSGKGLPCPTEAVDCKKGMGCSTPDIECTENRKCLRPLDRLGIENCAKSNQPMPGMKQTVPSPIMDFYKTKWRYKPQGPERTMYPTGPFSPPSLLQEKWAEAKNEHIAYGGGAYVAPLSAHPTGFVWESDGSGECLYPKSNDFNDRILEKDLQEACASFEGCPGYAIKVSADRDSNDKLKNRLIGQICSDLGGGTDWEYPIPSSEKDYGTWRICRLKSRDLQESDCLIQEGDGQCCENGWTYDTMKKECVEDIDCSGKWSKCTDSCEGAEQRKWTELIPQSGSGLVCPGPSDCQPGEDECPLDIDCKGEWGSCTGGCERIWTETEAQSGAGAECPTTYTPCQPGEGNCPSNCEGSWSACSTTCTRTWTETRAQHGAGSPCPNDSIGCPPGTDNCPIICNSGEKPDPSECTADCEVLITIPSSIPLNRVDECTTLTHICMPGNGQCCEQGWSYDQDQGNCVQDVDCVTTFSPCDIECSRKPTIIIQKSGKGSACPLPPPCQYGEGTCCSPDWTYKGNGCEQDIDCVGDWSKCTSACERTWKQISAQSGSGAACPEVQECQHDEGECCNTGWTYKGDGCEQDIDCVGNWSECSTTCTKAYTISVNQSGSGAECEAQAREIQTCSPGEDNCPDNVDCDGYWSECTSACERTWTQTAAQSGSGAACPSSPGDCAAGDGDCVNPPPPPAPDGAMVLRSDYNGAAVVAVPVLKKHLDDNLGDVLSLERHISICAEDGRATPQTDFLEANPGMRGEFMRLYAGDANAAEAAGVLSNAADAGNFSVSGYSPNWTNQTFTHISGNNIGNGYFGYMQAGSEGYKGHVLRVNPAGEVSSSTKVSRNAEGGTPKVHLREGDHVFCASAPVDCPDTWMQDYPFAHPIRCKVDGKIGRQELDGTWVKGNPGETCTDACGREGLGCTDGDWGIHDAGSFQQAVVQATGDLAGPGAIVWRQALKEDRHYAPTHAGHDLDLYGLCSNYGKQLTEKGPYTEHPSGSNSVGGSPYIIYKSRNTGTPKDISGATYGPCVYAPDGEISICDVDPSDGSFMAPFNEASGKEERICKCG